MGTKRTSGKGWREREGEREYAYRTQGIDIVTILLLPIYLKDRT